MKRGEVWWARLPLLAGRRPVVLVSRDSAYLARTSVTVAPVSTRIRAIPSEVPLADRDGLPRRCVVQADNLVTIPKTHLEAKLTMLTPQRLAQLDNALRFSLGLDR